VSKLEKAGEENFSRILKEKVPALIFSKLFFTDGK
jgi:hypothetical protein